MRNVSILCRVELFRYSIYFFDKNLKSDFELDIKPQVNLNSKVKYELTFEPNNSKETHGSQVYQATALGLGDLETLNMKRNDIYIIHYIIH